MELFKYKKMKFKFTIIICSIFIILPAMSLAGYDPNDIISNRLYYNPGSMSTGDIQNFLSNKGSYLTNYYAGGHKASAVIYNASRAYGLSPKVLLVMLQKEQSLIEKRNPSAWNLNWATGYGVGQERYRGFKNQVESAAYSLGVGYDKNKSWYNYDTGKKTVTQDGVAVTPKNRATANLFIYNPVAGVDGHNGNYLFWTLWWNRYFGTFFPTGTLIRENGTQGVYLVGQDGKKHGFWGNSAFSLSYKQNYVIDASSSEVGSFGTGDPIKLRDGVIFRSPNGAVFISQSQMRKGIPDQETLRLLGYNNADPVDVSWTEVNLLPPAQKYDKKNLNRPNGTFIKLAEKPGVYLYENGKKRPIWDKEILNYNYNNIKVIMVSRKEFDSYSIGAPVKFRDGALLRAPSGGIYVISAGYKHGIASREVFDGLGYKMSNVIPARQAVLDLHPTGKTINGN